MLHRRRAACRTLPRVLIGLGLDAKGDWERAHESAQEDVGRGGAWVHAYLQRKEGDQKKAAYWYAGAGKTVCGVPLDAQWCSIAKAPCTTIPKMA
jgi:hypothetical protein